MRRQFLIGTLIWCWWSASVFAQMTVTLAIFPATATDANTSLPVMPPVTYGDSVCGQPKYVEVVPLVNPADAYFDDPSNVTQDCTIDMLMQMRGVPDGSGYKAAMKVGAGRYGLFSSPFVVLSCHPQIAIVRAMIVPLRSKYLNAATHRALLSAVDALWPACV